MVMQSEKILLRENARKLRSLNAADVEVSFLSVVTSIPAFNSARAIGLYAAHGVEARTFDIIAECFRLGKHVAIPAWDSVISGYSFCSIGSATQLSPAKIGILEPDIKIQVDASALDLIIVPGVMFDTAGTRLGHGRGYYDRMLAGRRPGACLVGLAFEWQISPTPIPREAHDVTMNMLATPSRLITISPAGV